jgi:hypothetical protein
MIFLAWLIAAFLPLPPKPSVDEEAITVGPDIETRIREFEERRYQNARWWRNVNRIMIPVGMAIAAVIVSVRLCLQHGPGLISCLLQVTLAVVGTTVGFH